MYHCLYYWLFAPLRKGVVDSPERLAAFVIPVEASEGSACELALYCDEEGQPEFARCRIPGLTDESVPEKMLPLLQVLKEHLLSVLKMTYSLDISLAKPGAVWAFIKEGEPVNVNLLVEESWINSYDPKPTRHLFIQSLEFREALRLYLDGGDERIPLQYRYLSLYKLLELRYRKHGYWNKRALSDLLAKYKDDFHKQGFQGDPVAALHDLRDKCAHIKTGASGKREALGVTHLNLPEITRVERMLPVLRAVCAASVNEQAVGKFSLSAEVVHERFKRVESDA